MSLRIRNQITKINNKFTNKKMIEITIKHKINSRIILLAIDIARKLHKKKCKEKQQTFKVQLGIAMGNLI